MIDENGIVESVASGPVLVQVPRQEDGGQGGAQVGQCASEAENTGFSRDIRQSERVSDDILPLISSGGYQHRWLHPPSHALTRLLRLGRPVISGPLLQQHAAPSFRRRRD